MVDPASTTPTKLFREEAQTGAVQCPACGGPITLKGFGAIERVTCPYCGSELSPEDSGELNLLQQAERQRRQSVLPLQTRATFEGCEWELIGIVWRECRVDGVVYPWQEFLLFNPYRGYRYLVHAMDTGHWTIGSALPGAPQVQSSGHRKVQYRKTKYKHFQTVVATVSYVEGEFPWQVRVGDQAVTHEYVAPPVSISIEETTTAQGQDVAFTRMEHIAPSDVWAAFKDAQGSPPPTSGIGSVVPNPWKKGQWTTWIMFAGLLLAWLVASIVYVNGRTNKVVFERNNITDMTPFTETIDIGTPGKKTTLELNFHAKRLSNGWAFLQVMLISEKTEKAIAFSLTAEEWHGSSGGEGWREGDSTPSVVLGDIEGGTYLLQIAPSAGQKGAKKDTPPAGLKLNVRLKEDVVMLRYSVLALLLILFFPFFYRLLSALYEGRRWANSDYSSSG